jgi:hypothetical protein
MDTNAGAATVTAGVRIIDTGRGVADCCVGS